MYHNLLKTILQYQGPGRPKPIVYWQRMKQTIDIRVSMYTDRVINGSYANAPWSQFIKSLLYQIPVKTLLEIPKLSARYATMMLDVANRLDFFIAPDFILKTRYNKFVSAKNNQPVQEYLIPCKSKTPLSDLPIGDNIRFWDKVYPVRILYCDTSELCGDFLNMQFNYKFEQPKMLIASINTISLVFKYMEYCEDRINRKQEIDNNEFIMKHVMPILYKDIVNCWFMYMLNRYVAANEELTENYQFNVTPNIITDAGVATGCKDLTKYWQNLANKSYFVWDFTITPWFIEAGWDDNTINGFIRFLNHDISFPFLKQSAYLRLIISLPIVRMIVKLNRLSNMSINWRMNKDINIALNRMLTAGVVNACVDESIRRDLEKQVADVIALSKRDDIYPTDTEDNTF